MESQQQEVQVTSGDVIDALAEELGQCMKRNTILRLANGQAQRELAQLKEIALRLDEENHELRAQLAAKQEV